MIIFIGMSGAGKGTQSGLLAQENGYSYISSGQIVRDHANEDQKAAMLAGKWLPDSEILLMVDKALQAAPDQNRVILDGTPRTLAQAQWLLAEARKGRFEIEAVFNLEVSLEVAKGRLQNRHRVDDNDPAIQERFMQHRLQVSPILDYWRSQGVPVYDLDGALSPEMVHREIMSHVKLEQV